MKISHITSPEKEKKNRHLTLPLVQVLMETNELGQILATYTRGNRLISRSSQVVTYCYYFDALGSIRQIADTTGRLQGFIYCAFGTLIEQTETGSAAGNPTPDTSTGKAEVGLIIFLSLGLGILILKNRKGALILFLSIFLITIPGHPQAAIQAHAPPNPYGFTGERQFNEPDGLIFLRARYYDPSIGRFISRDPILLPMMGDRGSFWMLPYLVNLPHQLLHPYVYTANNPINFTDPTGLIRMPRIPGIKPPWEKVARKIIRYGVSWIWCITLLRGITIEQDRLDEVDFGCEIPPQFRGHEITLDDVQAVRKCCDALRYHVWPGFTEQCVTFFMRLR